MSKIRSLFYKSIVKQEIYYLLAKGVYHRRFLSQV